MKAISAQICRLHPFFNNRILGLEKHQLDMIMRECHLAVLAFVVSSTLIYLTLMQLPTVAADIWYVTLSIIHLSEFLIIYLYKSEIILPPDSPFFRVFVWIAGFFTGFAWSSFLFFLPFAGFFELHEILQVLLVYAGVVLILAAGSTYYLPVYFSIFAGLTIPPVYLLGLAEFENSVLLLGSLLFLLFVHICLVLANNRNSADLYLEQRRNEKLVKDLQNERNNSLSLHAKSEGLLLQKNLFIAAASHDLRQPLHAFGLYLEAIKQHIDSEEGKKIRQSMLVSVEALNHSFSGLLDTANLDSGMVEVCVETFELGSFLNNRVESFRVEALEQGLLFEIEGPEVSVMADPLLLDRIVRNLISNAITYTDSGRVSVSWECKNKDVILSIQDTGVGIPETQLELVFNEYFQIKSTRQKNTSGLGLGLSIVKKLCDLTGTILRVDSEVNVGTRFTVILPIGGAVNIPVVDAVKSISSLKGLSVVIVDDDELVLKGMVRLMTEWGCNVMSAQTLKGLLDKMLNGDFIPEFIIVDYQLQNSERGTDVIHRLREEFNSEIPALVISGDTSRDAVDKIGFAGCVLLSKPVLPEKFGKAILDTLG